MAFLFFLWQKLVYWAYSLTTDISQTLVKPQEKFNTVLLYLHSLDGIFLGIVLFMQLEMKWDNGTN